MGGGGGRSKPSGLLLFVCPGPGRLLGRAARTAVTSAQNAGRLDSYAAAGKLGIKLKKEWLATLDGRTRHAHALLDGQQRETSEPFEAEGEKLQFPGDPAAAGWMVYNCRCTMAAVVTGADGRALGGSAQRWVRDPVTGQGVRIEDMSFGEWVEWKERQLKERQPIVNLQKDSILTSGGRITDPYSKRALAFAKMYYEEIRHFSTDAKKIAQNTGLPEEKIQKIKAYLFLDDSLYDSKIGRWRRFDADAAIAQSWQRLMIGVHIKPHDLTLLRHEILEMEIKRTHPGISHDEAHTLASMQYKYNKESEEYYGTLKERPARR